MRRRSEPAERRRQGAAVVAAHNCNWARVRGKAQSYLCRRSSAEPVPNPNANTANAITKHFFPMIEEFLLLFPQWNPTMSTKLPWNVRKQILMRIDTNLFAVGALERRRLG